MRIYSLGLPIDELFNSYLKLLAEGTAVTTSICNKYKNKRSVVLFGLL